MIRERIRIVVRGAVKGWVLPFAVIDLRRSFGSTVGLNSAQGVFIEGEKRRRDSLNRFLVRLEKRKTTPRRHSELRIFLPRSG